MSTSSPQATDPTAPADNQPQPPDPITEPGEPTALSDLLEVGRYIPHEQLPTLNDLPRVVGALIYGENVRGYVRELRQAGYSDLEISGQVSHVISPPVPGSTPTVIQGVDPAAHQALQDQVAELRGLVADLQQQRAALPAGSTAAAPAEAPAPTSGAPGTIATTQDPREQEVQELRALVDSLSAQVATAQHPTATSEPVPPADVTPAPAGPDPAATAPADVQPADASPEPPGGPVTSAEPAPPGPSEPPA